MTGTLQWRYTNEPLRLLTGLLHETELARFFTFRRQHQQVLHHPYRQPELPEPQELHHPYHRFHHPC